VHEQQGRMKELFSRWEQLRQGTGEIMKINLMLKSKNRPGLKAD
jgi:hypothetical protein